MRVAVVSLAFALHLTVGTVSTSSTAFGPASFHEEVARPKAHLSTEAQAWVELQGGLVEHERFAQMQATVDELASAAGLRPVTLWVINNDSPRARSAPPNDVFLHTGLIDLADDAELATVIAHELAHLTEMHDTGVFHLLDDRHRALDEEARADAVGLMILDFAGYDTDTMLTFMTRVRDHMGVKDPAWGVLNRRLMILRQTHAVLFDADASADTHPRG